MEHSPDLGEVPDNSQAVAVGLPVVDDDGEVQLPGQGHLVPEHPALELPGRVLLPVVVQSDLPDGHALVPAGHVPDGIQVLLPVGGAVLRVVAHGGVEEGPLRRQGQGRLAGGEVAARVDHQGHPGPRQGGEDAVPVRVELLRVVVGVGVKKLHGAPSHTAAPPLVSAVK